MLNVLKLNGVIPEHIEIDQYIPIKIRWGSWNVSDEETVYWRTGDLKKSLLEIGIASKSGIIRSLTIVHTDKIFLDAKKMSWKSVSEEGTPIFNLNGQSECSKIDDVGLFEIHFCSNEVYLIISNNTVVKKVLSERVCFGLDDNSNVCIISVSGLTDEESYQVKDTLMYMKNQNNM